MLRCATLALSLLIVSSFRRAKKTDQNVEELGYAPASAPATLSQNISNTLGNLTLEEVTPTQIAVNLIEGIAAFDFTDPDCCKQQIANLALNRAIGLGSTLANAAHPLLGVTFSLFAGLIGFNGTNTNAPLVQNILEQVQDMIQQSFADFSVELAREAKSGVMTTINNAADQGPEAWNALPGTLANSWVSVFRVSCWDTKHSDACKQYRTSGGGANALMLELQFTDMMIAITPEVKEYSTGSLLAFSDEIKHASDLTREHFTTFRAYRQDWDSSDHGIRKGRVECVCTQYPSAPYPIGYCRTLASTDLITNQVICDEERRDPRLPSTNCIVERSDYEARQATCLRNHKAPIYQNMHRLDAQTRAAQDAAYEFRDQIRGLSRRRRRTQ